LKVVSESRVTWDISVPILVFLLGSRLRRTRQTDVRQTSDKSTPAYWGQGHNKLEVAAALGNHDNNNNPRLAAIFQDNPDKPVPECLHSTFHWSYDGWWRCWGLVL